MWIASSNVVNGQVVVEAKLLARHIREAENVARYPRKGPLPRRACHSATTSIVRDSAFGR